MSITADFVKKMSNGEVLKNKRVLSAMKRMGLISNYDEYGCVENVKVNYNGGYLYMQLFPKCNIEETKGKVFDSRDGIKNTFGSNRLIKYEGSMFTTSCVNGGVQNYLVKVGKC